MERSIQRPRPLLAAMSVVAGLLGGCATTSTSASNATVNAGLLGVITLPATNLAPGTKVDDHILLAIRPEHLRIAAQGVAGEVVTATFLGGRSHFHVKIDGRTEPVAVSGQPPSGNAVTLAFPPENLIGLPSGD